MNTPRVRRGRDATASEEEWLALAKEDLSAGASLARVETTARLTFAFVGGTTGLISALGLTGSARQGLLDDTRIVGIPWPLLVLLASVALAGLALVPALRSFDTASPSAVEAFYRGAILRRGLLVLAALLFAAIGATGAVTAAIKPASLRVQLHTSALTTGRHLRISATASTARLDGKSLELVVRRNANGPVICRSGRTVGRGAATVACGPVKTTSSRVTVTVTAGASRVSKTIRRGR